MSRTLVQHACAVMATVVSIVVCQSLYGEDIGELRDVVVEKTDDRMVVSFVIKEGQCILLGMLEGDHSSIRPMSGTVFDIVASPETGDIIRLKFQIMSPERKDPERRWSFGWGHDVGRWWLSYRWHRSISESEVSEVGGIISLPGMNADNAIHLFPFRRLADSTVDCVVLLVAPDTETLKSLSTFKEHPYFGWEKSFRKMSTGFPLDIMSGEE